MTTREQDRVVERVTLQHVAAHVMPVTEPDENDEQAFVVVAREDDRDRGRYLYVPADGITRDATIWEVVRARGPQR